MKNKNELLIKQIFLFCLQYLILFIIFLMILYYLKIDNFFYLSLLITSLVDFSFLFALTPYSVGITEFMTIMGTRDNTLSFAEIIVLINLFRLCMLSIYFVFGPIFIIYKTMIFMECKNLFIMKLFLFFKWTKNRVCQFCHHHYPGKMIFHLIVTVRQKF